MLKIFKYQIEIDDYFTVELPKGAKILTVDVQSESPQMWALVNPDMLTEMRRFRFAGTGHPIQERLEDLEFINTFQMAGGRLVFHIFEVKSESSSDKGPETQGDDKD